MPLYCPKCGKLKPEEAFAESSVRATGRQYWCRACKRQYDLELYHNDPQRKATIRRSNARREKILAARLYDYLGKHPCVDCGERNPLKLELDAPPSKAKPVILAQSVRGGLTNWKVLEAKLRKYEVRCANCRRLRLRKQFGWFGWSFQEITKRKSEYTKKRS